MQRHVYCLRQHSGERHGELDTVGRRRGWTVEASACEHGIQGGIPAQSGYLDEIGYLPARDELDDTNKREQRA